MNAPARIDHPQRQKEPHWARYLPSVEALRPDSTPEEARHRAGLMLLRDLAAVEQRRASDEAAAVLHVVQTLAARHALSSLSVEQLDAARLALVRIYVGAGKLEEVFGRGNG